jgi:hypothetical protein
MRRPLVIYDFAAAPIGISLYKRIFFNSVEQREAEGYRGLILVTVLPTRGEADFTHYVKYSKKGRGGSYLITCEWGELSCSIPSLHNSLKTLKLITAFLP